MEIVSIDVEDGESKINVAVGDYFEARRLRRYLQSAKQALNEQDAVNDTLVDFESWWDDVPTIFPSQYKACFEEVWMAATRTERARRVKSEEVSNDDL
jgi:hypothetical protein